MDKIILKYDIKIYEKVKDLLKSGKKIDDFDYKSDLHKIFEWFSCIMLTLEYQTPFYEYDDIDPTFKENNYLSKNDTGIDVCNLIDTIVQCKLRQYSLNWKECGTFFASGLYRNKLNKLECRWNNLIITRNKESKLAYNLNNKLEVIKFIDKTYAREELISYCKNLIVNPPTYPKEVNNEYKIRDYQKECIELITNIDNKKNLIISLPTGTGKNFIIAHSLLENKKYLILVPRIILMEQIKYEILNFHSKMKDKIQLIGDSNIDFDNTKNITICVFNSVNIVEKHITKFDKIFVDEAHHINKPEIYIEEENTTDSITNEINDNLEIDDSDDEYNEEDCIEAVEDDTSDMDDSENENCENTTFIKIIKSFQKYNNNVYLSATIDEHPNFNYYKKDIREMISKGYLCDYTINIPIFNDDPSNYNICKYIIKNYGNIIIYCNSQKEGDAINKIMNQIQHGCSDYIDCKTSRVKRNHILDKYKSGDLLFLVNVKILVEGFDAPITKGVCFMHLPSSQTTVIQIIGRALRLHQSKEIANVILPYSSNNEDKTINNFLKIIVKNDSRYLKTYQEKIEGGYISLNIMEKNESDDINSIFHKYDLIYNSFGTLRNSVEVWNIKFEEYKSFIDKFGKRPSTCNKHKHIKCLGVWGCTQLSNFNMKRHIMCNEIVYNKWYNFMTSEKYKTYFLNYKEIWLKKLKKLIAYFDLYQKLPSPYDNDIDVKRLCRWVYAQNKNFKIKKDIMSEDKFYNLWYDFVKNYLPDNDLIWNNNLQEVKKYLNRYNKRPDSHSNDPTVKHLSNWISTQITRYNNSDKKKYIKYQEWRGFILSDEYKIYFQNPEYDSSKWFNKLNEVKEYVDKNDKRPSDSDKSDGISSLRKWVSKQITNYREKNQDMKRDDIYKAWTDFINDDKYQKYFLDKETIWFNNLQKTKDYIDKNKKKPPFNTNYCLEIRQLNYWLYEQIKKYKLKKSIFINQNICDKWLEFITDNKYKIYFM